MWRPAQLRLGYVGRPALRGPRLGQSNAVINQAAAAVVAQAEPRVRAIVAEERSKLAGGAIQALPYMGGALTVFLATQYLLPKDKKFERGIGYVAAAGLFTIGAWAAFNELSEEDTVAPTPSSDGGVLSIFGDTARQMAQVVVAEAEPKIRVIIDEEKAKLSQAGLETLPFLGISTAGFLATAFLVPENKNVWKFGGYLTSAAALLAGIWKGLTVAS